MTHTEPDPQNSDDDGIRLEEHDFGDTELDRDDTHGMADDAAEAAENAEGHA
jgi:hypothetical protein